MDSFKNEAKDYRKDSNGIRAGHVLQMLVRVKKKQIKWYVVAH
jgi:hypothetical protein